MKLESILETSIYCSNLLDAKLFYEQILGLECVAFVENRHVFLKCGPGMLLVFDPNTTRNVISNVNGVRIPPHGARGEGHLAFRASEETLGKWREHLVSRGISIESDVCWPHGGKSLYFRDPSGNSVEIATASIWPLDE